MEAAAETTHNSMAGPIAEVAAKGLGLVAMGVLAMHNPETLKAGMVVGAEGLGFVALTTMYNHRELTHDSLKLGRPLRGVARTTMRALGMNPYVWAATHEVHHSVTDANFVPLIETADYLEYRDAHGITEPPVPEIFTGLDPSANLTPNQIKSIGASARKHVAGEYEPTQIYSDEEEIRLLDSTMPRYFYPRRPGSFSKLIRRNKVFDEPKTVGNLSLERLTSKLRDPHSPALHREGVRGVYHDDVDLYRTAGEFFIPNENRPERLRQDPSDRIATKPKWGHRALIAGNMAIVGAILGGFAPETFAYAAVGLPLTGVVATVLRQGGDITNAFGHGGKQSIRAFFTGKIIVKPDGTYATDSGLLGLSTFDEAGRQGIHHRFPGRIAYSIKRGVKKLLEAPFGTELEFAATHNIGMAPGNNFGLAPGERRPDEPMEALVLLQNARILTREHNLKQFELVAT